MARGRPEIFNTDQGARFTAEAFTSRLRARGIAISMDGRGRALDNVFIERLWRTVKYEEVYRKEYRDGWEAEASLASYFRFYRHERGHQSLNYRTPAEVYGAGDSSPRCRKDEKHQQLPRPKERQTVIDPSSRFCVRARPGKGLAGR